MISEDKILEMMHNDVDAFVCPKCGSIHGIDECMMTMSKFNSMVMVPACPECSEEMIDKVTYARMANIFEMMSSVDRNLCPEAEAMYGLIDEYGLADIFPPDYYSSMHTDMLAALLTDIREHDKAPTEPSHDSATRAARRMFLDIYALWRIRDLDDDERKILLETARAGGQEADRWANML